MCYGIEKSDVEKAIEEDIKNHKLFFLPASDSFWSGKQPARYKYIANGNENLASIKAKFHLADGVINKHNPIYKDDGCFPSPGAEIYFYPEEVGK